MGGAVWMSSHAIQHWLGQGRLARLTDLVCSIPLGLLVFYGSCRAIRVPELELATRSLVGPILRRLQRKAT